MSLDIDKEWDTDEISITSTVIAGSSDGEEYAIDKILSEKDVKDYSDKYGPGKRWLVKWEGYGMHECCWEPLSHFAGGHKHIALVLWDKFKASMTPDALRRYMEQNELKYAEALYKAYEARLDRKKKRAKKREKVASLKARARPIIREDSEDENSISPRPRTRASQQQKTSLQRALEDREAADSSQVNSLFIDSPDGEAPTRQTRKPRRPPIVQSESSLSESDLTDDSLMAEIGQKSKKSKKSKLKSTEKASTTERRLTRRAARASQTPRNDAAEVPSRKPVPKSKQPKKVTFKDPEKSPPRGSTSKQAAPSSAVAQRRGSNASESSGASTDSTTHATPSSGTAARSSLKFVNEPKTQSRSQWKKGDKPFSTLHYRAVAAKRSRAEGTPDISALEIVNDPSATVKATARRSSSDLYGRREPTRRREADDSGHDDDRGPGTTHLNLPLAPWEAEKIPMVCNAWRLSRNCPNTAQACAFLHRHKDPDGRDLPVHDGTEMVPPKYRRQPLTCVWWLSGPKGCFKSDDECIYAHRNTGYIQNHKSPNDPPVAIDSSALPIAKSTANRAPASGLTCWYWANATCEKSVQDCTFRHYHTGVVAAKGGTRGNTMHAREDGTQDDHDGSTGGDSVSMDLNSNSGDSAVLTANTHTVPVDRTETIQPFHHVTGELQPQPSFPLPLLPPPPPPPPPPPFEAPPPKISCPSLEAEIGSVVKLNFKDMFARSDGANPFVERRAFLIYHPEQHAEELALITRWLMMHHVQIGSAHYEGAWEDFQQQIKKGGSGIIIAHPDFVYYTELPGFGAVLLKEVRLWSVGLQEGLECDSARSDKPPVVRNDCIEVFPVGGLIYITEEVFEKKPQLALKLIQLFCAKVARLRDQKSVGNEADDADLLWRLCVRPELMAHLLKYCEDHEKELEAGDADMQSRAQLYTLLAETGYIEQDDPVTPLSLVPDKFPILSERREVAECQPVNYFGALARSREAANLNMIRYYAGLQVDLRRDYRHFAVVHTEPSAPYVHRWMEEIQTIATVITPEQCVDEFSKDERESMFDFCERFLHESRGNS